MAIRNNLTTTAVNNVYTIIHQGVLHMPYDEEQ
jgi:hypothetical protein